MKLRIGIDVDGCVYPWTQAVNDALKLKYELELGEHEHWNWLQQTITKQQWEWIWSSDAAPIVFGRLDLIYPGAKRAIDKLCQDHEVHFVTHRHPRRVAGETGRWLNYHFRNYTGVHVIHNRCRKHELGSWDVFIDDKVSTLLEFDWETNSLLLAPARPWNEELEGTDVVRFDHWDEVPTLINPITNHKGNK